MLRSLVPCSTEAAPRLIRADDAPALQQESLQLGSVHPDAALADAHRWQFPPLNQLVCARPWQSQKLRRFRNPEPHLLSIHQRLPDCTPASTNVMIDNKA